MELYLLHMTNCSCEICLGSSEVKLKSSCEHEETAPEFNCVQSLTNISCSLTLTHGWPWNIVFQSSFQMFVRCSLVVWRWRQVPCCSETSGNSHSALWNTIPSCWRPENYLRSISFLSSKQPAGSSSHCNRLHAGTPLAMLMLVRGMLMGANGPCYGQRTPAEGGGPPAERDGAFRPQKRKWRSSVFHISRDKVSPDELQQTGNVPRCLLQHLFPSRGSM